MGPAYLPLSYTPPHFTNPTLPHSVTTHSITPITTPIASTIFQPGGVQQIITSKPVTETQPSTETALLVSEIEADVSNDQDMSGASEKESVDDGDSELKSLSLGLSAYTRALVCCHTPPLTTHLGDTSSVRACVLLIEP